MNDVFHYPPDLFDLFVQAIPLLNRSKESVLFFKMNARKRGNLKVEIAILGKEPYERNIDAQRDSSP
jgi:hypothetical protein